MQTNHMITILFENMSGERNKQTSTKYGKNCNARTLPASLDTSVQISKKQLPCDQNLHRNPAYKYKAFSKHIFSFHKVTTPVEKVKSFNTSRSLETKLRNKASVINSKNFQHLSQQIIRDLKIRYMAKLIPQRLNA